MDALLNYIQKNAATTFIIAMLLPIGAVLLYSSVTNFWKRQRFKKESAAILAFFKQSDADEKALTNDEISTATGIPRERVIEVCADNKEIMDAGKRQRSWKLKKPDGSSAN